MYTITVHKRHDRNLYFHGFFFLMDNGNHLLSKCFDDDNLDVNVVVVGHAFHQFAN